MLNLIKLQLKRMFTNKVYIGSYIGVILSIVLMEIITKSGGVKFMNYIVKFDLYTYVEVVIFALLFFVACYLLYQKSNIEESSFYSKNEILTSKIISILVLFLSFLLVPILFVIISAFIEKTELLFTVNALKYVIIRWSLIILTTTSIASISHYYVDSQLIYLLTIPFTIVFTYINALPISVFIKKRILVDKISAFLSVQKPFVAGSQVDYTGPIVDKLLISKLLYTALFFAIVLFLLKLFTSKRKLINLIFVVVLIGLEFFAIRTWFNKYPSEYEATEKIMSKNEEKTAEVISYGGDIKLGEPLEASISMKFKPLGDKAIFRLDSNFEIEEISLNGTKPMYSRLGDLLILETEKGLEEYTLEIKYAGRIYYLNNIHVIDLFSTKYSSALPANFAFIPIEPNSNAYKNYDLTIYSHNYIASNLNVDKLNDKEYKLHGSQTSLTIFSGYITETIVDEKQCYISKYNRITDYEKQFNESIGLGYKDANTGELVKESYKEHDRNINKIFMFYINYGANGFPILYDDYIMVDFGGTFIEQ